MLRGALAAAVTPLRDDGAALDEDAFRPYLDFLHAAGVAVIGPPYYAYDDAALLAHFAAAARASEPLPFYVYELKARSGYAVPVNVVEPYLLEGLDVFIGAEELLPVPGPAGAASGLASVSTEPVVEHAGVGDL